MCAANANGLCESYFFYSFYGISEWQCASVTRFACVSCEDKPRNLRDVDGDGADVGRADHEAERIGAVSMLTGEAIKSGSVGSQRVDPSDRIHSESL